MENRLGKKMHILVLHKNCYSAENMIQSLKGNLLTGITAFPQLSGFSLKISFSLTVATHTTYSQLSHNCHTKPIQNLSKTYPKPVQNLSKTYPKASNYTHYTHVSNYFLSSFITLVSISIDISVQFIWFFVSIKRPVRDQISIEKSSCYIILRAMPLH